MIILPENPDTIPAQKNHLEFHRFISNCISNSVSSSLWPGYAHHYKNKKKHLYENAIYLITYEPDAPVKALRVWLIFEEELKYLYDLNLSTHAMIDSYFKVPNPRWYLRIQNLQKWSNYAFYRDPITNELKLKMNASSHRDEDPHTKILHLPLYKEEDLLVTVEWNIFHHAQAPPQLNGPPSHFQHSQSIVQTPHTPGLPPQQNLPPAINRFDRQMTNMSLYDSPSSDSIGMESTGGVTTMSQYFRRQKRFEKIVQKSCKLEQLIHNYDQLRSFLLEEQRRIFSPANMASNSTSSTTSSSLSPSHAGLMNDAYNLIEKKLLKFHSQQESHLFYELINNFLTEELDHSRWCEYAYRHRYQSTPSSGIASSGDLMMSGHGEGDNEVYYFVSFEKCPISNVPRLQILLCFSEDLHHISTRHDIEKLCEEFHPHRPHHGLGGGGGGNRLSPVEMKERFQLLHYWGNHLSSTQRVVIPILGSEVSAHSY